MGKKRSDYDDFRVSEESNGFPDGSLRASSKVSQFSGSNDVIVTKTVSSTTVAFSDGLIKWLACSTSKFLKRQLPRREIHNIKFYQNVFCRPPSNKNHKRNCLMTTTSTRLLKSTLPVVIIIYYGSTVVIDCCSLRSDLIMRLRR